MRVRFVAERKARQGEPKPLSMGSRPAVDAIYRADGETAGPDAGDGVEDPAPVLVVIHDLAKDGDVPGVCRGLGHLQLQAEIGEELVPLIL